MPTSVTPPTPTKRCTYCLAEKPASAFTTVEHVMPAALGGEWKTREVCDDCQKRANEVADRVINGDPLVRFLRSSYGVPDRRGVVPPAPRFKFPVDAPDVPDAQPGVLVTLESDGATLKRAMSPATAALLGIKGESKDAEAHLRDIVGDDVRDLLDDPRELARAVQTDRTPPHAWSRFMAKLALACGRKAYGDTWLDGPHALRLSSDLLSNAPPLLSRQREHYPPVGETWPFLPPNHMLWIDDFGDVAVLHVVLFGQVLGAVPVNQAKAPSEYSAWRFDPVKRNFSHSSYPAIWLGTAAARASQTGRRSFTMLHGQPFLYVEDGPGGPMDIPVPTVRADSPADALAIAARHADAKAPSAGSGQPTTPLPGRPAARVGRNEPCACGSGIKYKRCCGK
jgi:HNH endonuclease/SEC-C motif